MSKEKIVQLNAQEPNVKSVLTSLNIYQDRIKNITCIIEWDTGDMQISCNTKLDRDFAYESMVFQRWVMDFLGKDDE